MLCGNPVLKCAAVGPASPRHDMHAIVWSILLRSVTARVVSDDHFAADAGLHSVVTHPGVRRGYFDSLLLWFPMEVLMAPNAEGDQILCGIIAQSASRLNMMNLKILHAPACLTSPAISLQDFAAELAISFWIKSQTGPDGSDPFQSVT